MQIKEIKHMCYLAYFSAYNEYSINANYSCDYNYCCYCFKNTFLCFLKPQISADDKNYSEIFFLSYSGELILKIFFSHAFFCFPSIQL